VSYAVEISSASGFPAYIDIDVESRTQINSSDSDRDQYQVELVVSLGGVHCVIICVCFSFTSMIYIARTGKFLVSRSSCEGI
jgi:hypothetical protein